MQWQAYNPVLFHTCEHCGEAYEPRHPAQKYCGQSCLYKAARQRGGVALLERERSRDSVRRKQRHAALCADRWQAATEAIGAALSLALLNAGEPPPDPRRVASLLIARPAVGHHIAGTCIECGNSFVRNGQRRAYYCFCSTTCGRRAERSAHRDKRRSRKQGGERIYRRKVYTRDGWTCQLCGEPIDQAVVVPHPHAATIDHIVALANGGSHTYANVQTAHFICNSRKGAAPNAAPITTYDSTTHAAG